MTFAEWWEKNGAIWSADCYHMSDFHMASVVWDAAIEESAQIAESHEVDYGNTATVAANDIRELLVNGGER